MRVKNAYPKTHISEKTRIPPASIICMVLRNVGKKRIKFQNINYHNTHIFSKFQNKTHIFQNFTRIKKKKPICPRGPSWDPLQRKKV